jgi:hypothetical protein
MSDIEFGQDSTLRFSLREMQNCITGRYGSSTPNQCPPRLLPHPKNHLLLFFFFCAFFFITVRAATSLARLP